MSNPGEPVRPLTRREIREREQAAAEAAAAERAARSAPTPPASSGYGQRPASSGYDRSAGGAPASTPPRASYGGASRPTEHPRAESPRAENPPSRRTMRDAEVGRASSSTPPPRQAPSVRPPSSSVASRGLDETGRLTPVQDTGGFAVRPSAATPHPSASPDGPRPSTTSVFGQAPTRDDAQWASSSRTTNPGSRSAAESRPTPYPAQPDATATFGAAPAARPPFGASEREQPDSTRTAPPRASVLSRGSAAPERTPFGTPREPEPSAGKASPLPWGSAPVATVTAPAVDEPKTTPDVEPAPDLPWGSIAPAEKPSSFPVSRRSAPASDEGPFGRSANRSEAAAVDEDDEDWDDEDDNPHAYTWLHYLILVAVAFVLGLLIWELGFSEDKGSFDDSAAPAVVFESPSPPALLS